MNKLEENQKKADFVDINEEQKILSDAENIIQKFNTPNINKTKKIKFLVLFPIFILLVLMLFSSTIFALVNINNSTIINGVYIQGIDVSGLSIEDAKNKVNSILNNQLSKNITLSHNDFSINVLPSQFNVSFDVDSAVNTAYSLARTNNIFNNNYTILNALSNKVNIELSTSYDIDLLNSIIDNINTNLPDAVVQPSYYIDNTNLIISNGKNGVVVDKQALNNKLFSILKDLSNDQLNIDIPITNSSANSINIESIYNDIHKEPVDASYTTNPYVVYPSSTGVDFNISMDEAKNILSTYQEEYSIPLKILYPNVSTSQIGADAFPDLLSEFSTSFSSSNSNRSTNIILAASKINGTVVMPGESFSYNQTVGKRTASAGFKEAPAYSNGEVVQELGGGVCQVSSTLYNAILYANLEVTERHNHGFKPSYVKPGLDATVSWGGPDLKFTNNRTYPIRIVCSTSGKTLHISIYGLKSDNDYQVTLEADYLSTVYSQTVYKIDSSLASGVKKVIQSGSNGCQTISYKILYDQNGNFVDKICISKDTYNAHNKIIAVGN